MWHGLLQNLAIVALFISAAGNAQDWLPRRRRLTRHILFGTLLAAGTIASMLTPVQLEPGLFVDLRSSLLTISSFFGGPLSGLITALLTVAVRIYLGGSGAFAGSLSILLSGAIGISGRFILRRRSTKWGHLPILALAASVAPLVGLLIAPLSKDADLFWEVALPLFVMNFITTLLAAAALQKARQASEERNLLKAALNQAPDYLYVKDRQSRFVETSRLVAASNGFSSSDQLHGLTDLDLTDDAHAGDLFNQEQAILSSGEPMVDYAERLVGADGKERWFVTSKIPVKNADGEVIGLSGLTRDVTERHQLDVELQASRNQLAYALQEMSDGLAMFDSNGILVFCNDQYRDAFPRTSALRKPGVPFREILAMVAATREQTGIPDHRADQWVDEVAQSLLTDGEQEVKLFDGRWIRIRTRRTSEGSAMVVTSDVTTIKEAEATLQVMTDQLKVLATTDGLTGLVNRRGFDQALDRELSRSIRNATAFSLLLADVDLFKKFNDQYGHPAGDECLRSVSRALQSGARRPSDTVARYGGEEFVAILPETDEDGAYVVAENLRAKIQKMAIPHAQSPAGVVTISVGLTTLKPGESMAAADLLTRADEALYDAKYAGRNRVMGWRRRYAGGASAGA